MDHGPQRTSLDRHWRLPQQIWNLLNCTGSKHPLYDGHHYPMWIDFLDGPSWKWLQVRSWTGTERLEHSLLFLFPRWVHRWLKYSLCPAQQRWNNPNFWNQNECHWMTSSSRRRPCRRHETLVVVWGPDHVEYNVYSIRFDGSQKFLVKLAQDCTHNTWELDFFSSRFLSTSVRLDGDHAKSSVCLADLASRRWLDRSTVWRISAECSLNLLSCLKWDLDK